MTAALSPAIDDRGNAPNIRRIRMLAKQIGSGCDCLSAVQEILARLSVPEKELVVRDLFKLAIRQRAKVAILVELTTGLEEFGFSIDHGEIEEAAMLFDDMAEQARLGSQILKAVAWNRLCDARVPWSVRTSRARCIEP